MRSEKEAIVRDAGYSWVILVIVLLEYSLVAMSFGCVGILYPEFVEHLNSSMHAAGWIGSLNISVGAFIGKYDTTLPFQSMLFIGRVSYLIYVCMRHYVLTTSGDMVVCFHAVVYLSCYFVNYVMAFSICYWANYTQGKTKLSQKSENAVADDQVLKFFYDADLRHVESSVRCHRKYKNGRIKVDLG